MCRRVLTMPALLLLFIFQLPFCHQCDGWSGDLPSGRSLPSTCENLNNQCETTQYCVKMLDPLAPDTPYRTFKSDCYYQNTIQMSPQNLSTVQSGLCYPYQDNNNPPKRWLYCFCSDVDYCNYGVPLRLSTLGGASIALAVLVLTLFAHSFQI